MELTGIKAQVHQKTNRLKRLRKVYKMIIYCIAALYTVKKGYGMSLTKLSVGGNNYYSRPGRAWLVTSRLGTGKRPDFFTV
jgi:hypothetical protein